uniref:Increased DNA methylation 3 n=1 Tax=Noccaea caerulescens TaxID=107243 RepID=A0A1J3IIQ6_NOCCA
MSLCSDGLSSDQYFLVNFIMSNYLGPDVYSDEPRISASQRLAKRLPPYTSMHIGSSSLTVAQLQNLYYHVLRNAKSSLLVHPDMIYMYLKGYLPLSRVFPQFTSFFPTNLHPQKKYSPSHEIVRGVVLIDDPSVAFISTEELQRFRCLSCLNDMKIDRFVSLCPLRVQLDENRGTEQEVSQVTSSGVVPNQEFNSSGELRENCKRKNEEEAAASLAVCGISKTSEGISVDIQESQVTDQDCSRNGEAISTVQETCKRKNEEEEEEVEAAGGHDVPGINRTPERFRETYRRKRFKNSSAKAKNKNGETGTERDKKDEPKIPKLVPFPCEPEPAAVTTGTASAGAKGPSIGAVDIGVNKAAYFFRVALPGVCKDYGEFSCEIESDGKVVLEGLSTTGQKTIKRHSRVFEMKTRKLCPPGPFKLCFTLPGPVDPRLFSPKFRSDGTFEAVIIRQKKNS